MYGVHRTLYHVVREGVSEEINLRQILSDQKGQQDQRLRLTGSGMKRGQCDWLREQRDGAVGGEGRGRSHRALVDHGKAGGYFIKRAMGSHIRDMVFG